MRDLSVDYHPPSGTVQAVRGLDLAIGAGTRVGLVGESGCGKSTVVAALLGLLPADATARGSITLDGDELLDADEARWATVRGRRIGVIPQGAMAGLHPSYRACDQVAEMVSVHRGARPAAAIAEAVELLAEVGLDEGAAQAHPHELSGGMRQRVALAATLAARPEVIVADEPTVGLDALTSARFLELLTSRQERDGFGLLFVSHDLDAVGRACDQLAICYAGQIVEAGPTAEVVARPAHPYAGGLLAAAPTLGGRGWSAIPGTVPDPRDPPVGCAFAPRCPHAAADCGVDPALRPLDRRDPVDADGAGGDGRQGRWVACHRVDEEGRAPVTTFGAVRRGASAAPGELVVAASGVTVTYGADRSWRRRRRVMALDDVELTVAAGEVVGLVGASGSGKSTLARTLLGLRRPDAGRVMVGGQDMAQLSGRALRRARQRLALVHQDPYASLHPAVPVVDLVAEPLAVAGVRRGERRRRAGDALASVSLEPTPDLLARRASGLSGGQRQRVALARAVVARPVLLVLDEPMSMLDTSLRAGIAQALLDARDDQATAVVLITHDLAEAAAICDRLVVMDHGRVVEDGPTGRIVADPSATATRQLFGLAAGGLTAPSAVAAGEGAALAAEARRGGDAGG